MTEGSCPSMARVNAALVTVDMAADDFSSSSVAVGVATVGVAVVLFDVQALSTASTRATAPASAVRGFIAGSYRRFWHFPEVPRRLPSVCHHARMVDRIRAAVRVWSSRMASVMGLHPTGNPG